MQHFGAPHVVKLASIRGQADVPTQKPRVYATLDPAQAAALEAIARKHEVSVGWLVRYAVARLIEADKEPVQLNLFVEMAKIKS
ncbi:ribbon-helix-helix protein, CopG family [Siccirubricoccus phaeus]|uniref:ribbon-helix-helix protein, CopG family n=1 Tax=Siccirubricoccus phaeus TaxID=2595053 RepID=UPI0011F330EF|nr:ribbon-helix-helix protein, CopG family [Siccirubricoccus phaeus]